MAGTKFNPKVLTPTKGLDAGSTIDDAPPLHWRRREMIFTCSLSDFFHQDGDPMATPSMGRSYAAPHGTDTTFLSKRISRVLSNPAKCLPPDWDTSGIKRSSMCGWESQLSPPGIIGAWTYSTESKRHFGGLAVNPCWSRYPICKSTDSGQQYTGVFPAANQICTTLDRKAEFRKSGSLTYVTNAPSLRCPSTFSKGEEASVVTVVVFQNTVAVKSPDACTKSTPYPRWSPRVPRTANAKDNEY